jgi:hypothetical protein
MRDGTIKRKHSQFERAVSRGTWNQGANLARELIEANVSSYEYREVYMGRSHHFSLADEFRSGFADYVETALHHRILSERKYVEVEEPSGAAALVQVLKSSDNDELKTLGTNFELFVQVAYTISHTLGSRRLINIDDLVRYDSSSQIGIEETFHHAIEDTVLRAFDLGIIDEDKAIDARVALWERSRITESTEAFPLLINRLRELGRDADADVIEQRNVSVVAKSIGGTEAAFQLTQLTDIAIETELESIREILKSATDDLIAVINWDKKDPGDHRERPEPDVVLVNEISPELIRARVFLAKFDPQATESLPRLLKKVATCGFRLDLRGHGVDEPQILAVLSYQDPKLLSARAAALALAKGTRVQELSTTRTSSELTGRAYGNFYGYAPISLEVVEGAQPPPNYPAEVLSAIYREIATRKYFDRRDYASARAESQAVIDLFSDSETGVDDAYGAYLATAHFQVARSLLAEGSDHRALIEEHLKATRDQSAVLALSIPKFASQHVLVKEMLIGLETSSAGKTPQGLFRDPGLPETS